MATGGLQDGENKMIRRDEREDKKHIIKQLPPRSNRNIIPPFIYVRIHEGAPQLTNDFGKAFIFGNLKEAENYIKLLSKTWDYLYPIELWEETKYLDLLQESEIEEEDGTSLETSLENDEIFYN